MKTKSEYPESKGLGTEESAEITDEDLFDAILGPLLALRDSEPVKTTIVSANTNITMPAGTVLKTYSQPSPTEAQVRAALRKIIEM